MSIQLHKICAIFAGGHPLETQSNFDLLPIHNIRLCKAEPFVMSDSGKNGSSA